MNKVLLVTGGSRGIGAATALLAAQQGWTVAVNYTANSLAADEVVRQIRSTGGNAIAVQADVADEAQVMRMYAHIEGFLATWLPALARDHRSYVTVALGCTGGQHRSVYLVERLAAAFAGRWTTLKRHRELDGH